MAQSPSLSQDAYNTHPHPQPPPAYAKHPPSHPTSALTPHCLRNSKTPPELVQTLPQPSALVIMVCCRCGLGRGLGRRLQEASGDAPAVLSVTSALR
ncbi:hypothetical protein EJ06DRAFT_531643 [Trichodelitschia bisporula]|uniref:Uncharacterized protein n=1 Tax=Trichodelitschia bisporula TaxID=703511 RepID=A0A6G1HU08_9PEZI|nr:hypothetical protein EJ06DRAFT_531643 [Trichodelitschia bisporula]